MLFVLALLWIRVVLFLLTVIVTCTVRLVYLILVSFSWVFGVIVFEIRIIAQLIAVAQVSDNLPRKFCKLSLITQTIIKLV